jgi:putative spermidine/putrescine transport system ATP-binding protein
VGPAANASEPTRQAREPSAPLSISARRVRKAYGKFVALRDVSFEVGAGEFLTLLGPSGSGKTTLLNIIAGFLRLDSGSILFGDEDVTLRPVNARGLGMVFQNYALFPHMTVGENVSFPLRVRRLPKAEITERVRSVLRLVRLEGMIERNVEALSGGQRQRVALARAVVFHPRIVLMDEPLSALDKGLREQMQIEIRQLHQKIGATTIYVTHDQREALTMSDRVAVMNHGTIVQCDSPTVVYHKPNVAFVAAFMGETTLLPVARANGGVELERPMVRSTPLGSHSHARGMRPPSEPVPRAGPRRAVPRRQPAPGRRGRGRETPHHPTLVARGLEKCSAHAGPDPERRARSQRHHPCSRELNSREEENHGEDGKRKI